MQNLLDSLNNSMIKELKKRIRRKSICAFLGEVSEIKSCISDAYEIGKCFIGKSAIEIDVATYQKICQEICRSLSIFADATDWLNDAILLEAKLNTKKIVGLVIDSWIDIAGTILKALEELTYAYTTYSDSFGMGNGDCSISNLFLNIKGHEEVKKPYFPDSLTRAAQILFRKGELELAARYALISAIEAIWDQYRYEKYDVFEALMAIPWKFEEQKRYDESAEYITELLEWLYQFYSRWRGQEIEELYIQQLQYELRDRLDHVNEETRHKVIGSLKKIIATIGKSNLVVDDFVLSSVIEILEKLGTLNDASRLVRITLFLIIENSKRIIDIDRSRLDDRLQKIHSLAELAFDLQEQNFGALKKGFDEMKSESLENRVSELAYYMGYREKGERVWKFKNPILHKFMKGKNTDSVEVDVHQYRTEHVSGKERRVIFAAECKYREKAARVSDVKFFQQKAADLYQRSKDLDDPFPRKITPKLGGLWFVSVNGFNKKALEEPFEVCNCKIELVDRVKLNHYLKANNVKEIAIR